LESIITPPAVGLKAMRFDLARRSLSMETIMTKFRNILHAVRFKRRLARKGTPHCRIISTKVVDGRELSFHATKGWRSFRVAQ
jgi:hypothetical protein